MKSIYEQAKENIEQNEDEILCVYDRFAGFVDGANYVLSVLYDAAYKEDWITNTKDGIRRFFEIYRQLKK